MATSENQNADTWCPVPWLGLSVRSVGDLRYCCHANASENKGLLQRDNGEIINLGEGDISEGINAPLLKNVRKAMLEGERHSGCQRCYFEEDNGIFSRRLSEQATWEHRVTKDQAKTLTEKDGQIDPTTSPLLYIDLRFGNRCNLKCRMCGPTESDRWYEVWTKMTESNRFSEGKRKLEIVQDQHGRHELKVDPYQWYENPSFWQDLENYLPRLERIYLAGGEPLLIESQFDFLQLCIDKGHAKNITLEYNSNITALNKKILNIWNHFKKIEVGMSIDGIGQVNDYIRQPSEWSKVEKNLQLLDKAEGNYKLWWAATIQAYNLVHLPFMMDWIIDQNFNRVNRVKFGREILTPHPLNRPHELSIKIFPEKSKKFIGELFKKAAAENREKVMSHPAYPDHDERQRIADRYERVLDNYYNIMMSEDLSSLLDKFWEKTRRLDEIHGTSFQEACPLAYELLKKKG